ncbi:MAG: ribonuclease HII [Candidatus Komeilibacteria bacterium CG_4_10_14_0_2_um_filter_37_10]|uniref:Ribonuclease HII n=1 Tax=Candidatus Komeilibacteria bacterium CG_4_10_14_0_2_um_filter_37_10 TaxID=1974470 RepID=A0A2M7VEE3_9BACT|nr:MAG: ribonuclease HII [Candidatus Komeilibacteria bacterium CG_4_10_14_0_2_um_filter_37_10]PJA92961.1 MAG: ribonuclease HII [Candidatus Komeilibacteria bacterium CG_4_9_14_3_um_filter_37_5]
MLIINHLDYQCGFFIHWRYNELMKDKKIIAGVDEVGRGAWAGPIVAAAVIFKNNLSVALQDSKKLTASRRQSLEKIIKENSYWAVVSISNKQIDRIGIQQANVLVMQKAIAKLKKKPTLILADMVRRGRFDIAYQFIIKGDEKIQQISAASIIAKVYRDRLMQQQHRRYPQYDFQHNVGYGTVKHQKGLKKYGPCVLHRTSYRPVQERLAK